MTNVNARHLATAQILTRIPTNASVVTMDHSNGYLPATSKLIMLSN